MELLTELPQPVAQELLNRFEVFTARLQDYTYGKPTEDDINAMWAEFRRGLEESII